MKTKLNVFGRFEEACKQVEREEEKELAKDDGLTDEEKIILNEPPQQQLSISPGTLVLGRLLFGKFEK